MGIPKEILTVEASGCFLTPFLPVPQNSQTPEQSPPTPLQHTQAMLAAHTRDRGKRVWEETVIKEPQLSKMALLGVLALRCCFSEQSSFHTALSFVYLHFGNLPEFRNFQALFSNLWTSK